MKRNLMLIGMLVVLIAIVLYFAFNGNPIAKQISKSTITNYLEETYPDDEFNIGEPVYSPKASGYGFQVEKIGDLEQKKYWFAVTSVFGTKVEYGGYYYENQDTTLIGKLSMEFNEFLVSKIEPSLPEIISIGPQIEVLNGKCSADTTWTKDFKPEKPMDIYITIDSSGQSKEDFLQSAIFVQKTLNKVGVEYGAVFMDGSSLDGGDVYYSVIFKPEMKLTIKDIQSEEH